MNCVHREFQRMYLSSLHQQLEEEEEGRSNQCPPKFHHPHSHQVNQLSVSHKVSQPPLLVSSQLASSLLHLSSCLASQPVSSLLHLSPHQWWLQGNHSREVKVGGKGRGRERNKGNGRERGMERERKRGEEERVRREKEQMKKGKREREGMRELKSK